MIMSAVPARAFASGRRWALDLAGVALDDNDRADLNPPLGLGDAPRCGRGRPSDRWGGSIGGAIGEPLTRSVLAGFEGWWLVLHSALAGFGIGTSSSIR
jgi:hypothetical protein